MFKKLFLPIIGLGVFIIIVGLLVKNPSKLGFIPITPASAQKEIKIGEKTIKVEVADSQATRAKGLSGRTSLLQDSGMLFVFDQKDVFPAFWMKDMLISIDIIWINDEKVVKIDKNVPIPSEGTTEKDLKLYRPDKPIDYVLEVNAGFSDKNGVTLDQSLSGL